jgi:hypothetical protein
VARVQGREGWLREAKRQLEQHRWRHPDPILRSRPERLLLAAERLETDLEVERRASETYERYRATARDRLGRRPGGRAEPYRPPELPAGKINLTDPDSRSIPVGFGFVQGYNAQAAVNEQQIVLAAEITNNSTDFSQLDPMVSARRAPHLLDAGIRGFRLGVALRRLPPLQGRAVRQPAAGGRPRLNQQLGGFIFVLPGAIEWDQ